MSTIPAPTPAQIMDVMDDFNELRDMCLRTAWSEKEVVAALENLQYKVRWLLRHGSAPMTL